jgi:hypothetical protein
VIAQLWNQFVRTRCFAKTHADEEINRGARNALHFCALTRCGIARVNEIATGLRAATPKPRKTRPKCFSYIRAAVKNNQTSRAETLEEAL